jgi:Tfp pilus assembly protein PilF
MTLRSRSASLAAAFVVACALAPLLGCATAAGRAEAQQRTRQARAHYDIGLDHIQKGRLELGLRELLRAERIDPRNAEIQHGIGMAYVAKGRVAEAERYFQRALSLDSDLQDARYNLATLYLATERYEEGLRESRRLYDDPTFIAPWRALTNMGWAEYKLGRIEEARDLLQLSRDYAPRYWPTLLNLGILEAEEGHKVEAIALFEELLALEPGASAEAETNYRLGEIYFSLGKREQAVGYLTAALVKTPSGQWGKKSEEYLKLLR